MDDLEQIGDEASIRRTKTKKWQDQQRNKLVARDVQVQSLNQYTYTPSHITHSIHMHITHITITTRNLLCTRVRMLTSVCFCFCFFAHLPACRSAQLMHFREAKRRSSSSRVCARHGSGSSIHPRDLTLPSPEREGLSPKLGDLEFV